MNVKKDRGPVMFNTMQPVMISALTLDLFHRLVITKGIHSMSTTGIKIRMNTGGANLAWERKAPGFMIAREIHYKNKSHPICTSTDRVNGSALLMSESGRCGISDIASIEITTINILKS